MSNRPDPTSIADFSYRYVSVISFWNHAESAAKQIAQLLLGESAMSMAVTAELGNRTLTQAIEVASHEMGEIGEHLRHFSDGFAILLGYRNFYVHGIYAIRHDGFVPGSTYGVLFTLDGKGRVRYFNRHLTITELDATIAAIHSLIGYAAAIQKELGATGDGLAALIESYKASLEKPSWPPNVEKTPLYLQGQEPPPPKPSRKRETPKKPNPA